MLFLRDPGQGRALFATLYSRLIHGPALCWLRRGRQFAGDGPVPNEKAAPQDTQQEACGRL